MLGLDTYSLRSFRWNVFQLLDYAASQNISTVQAAIASFESTSEAYLLKVKAEARRLNIHLEPGFGCISTLAKNWNPKQVSPVDYLQTAIQTAKTLEARSFRVYLGNPADRAAGTTPDAFIDQALQSLRAVRSQAQDAQLKIAIENHGEFHSRHIKTIIEQAGPAFVASCYDSGNPVLTAEDPLAVLESLAPHIVTAHIRDSVVFPHPHGAAVQWVALGDGSIDIVGLTRRFQRLCPNVPYHLEIITGRPPQVIPYLQQDFWKTDKSAPASSLARFERLVKTGHPFMGSMIIPTPNPPPQYLAALKEQERVDLERSFAFARQHLFNQ
jgi:sugar phosphate isomerase/epimerase